MSIACSATSINQPDAYISPAATRLRIPVPPKEMSLRHGEGVGSGKFGRMLYLRRIVATLFDLERVELGWSTACEARLYAERLIQEAVLASTEQNLVELFELWQKPTIEGESEESNEYPQAVNNQLLTDHINLNTSILELSIFWLAQTRLVEKLFKVFVPRYKMYHRAYTSLHRIQTPSQLPHTRHREGFGILELHGNPWPPVTGHGIHGRQLDPEPFKQYYLTNVLLNAIRRTRLGSRIESESTTAKDKECISFPIK